ncbi:hypothetical protein [Anthocerotibacter panamensis]|uniref:hypothetical protein n=1 Tax=Anthocerotibacter panamensis TaxID=2857077 RepID=UPI001C403F51|nr:hypothetical protein [Anthocerotibacter panamensis]
MNPPAPECAALVTIALPAPTARWLAEYLLQQSREAAIGSKRAKRAGDPARARDLWHLSTKLYAIARNFPGP